MFGPYNTYGGEVRDEFDAVTDSLLRLNHDEKIVHVYGRYELDENGKAFQPLITRIVKVSTVGLCGHTVWSSEAIIEEELKRNGYLVRNNYIPKDKINGFAPIGPSIQPPRVKADWIKPDRGFIDILQREIDGWIGNICQSG